jgi:acyl-CoA reductase-like NAD-dependent aldehyde dehydrogenase
MKPSRGEKTLHLKVTGFADGDDFLEASNSICREMRHAQARWAAITLRTRLQVIRRFRQLLAEQAESVAMSVVGSSPRSVAEILSSEMIPLAEAGNFVERRAETFLAPRRVGRRGRPLWLGGVTSVVYREPFGLVLVIGPSNYPIFLPGVQLLQALAAGNAVLLKPGPGGTGAAQELARLLNAAGLPASLLRVLPEFPEAAQVAIRAGVDKVFFTGSAATGVQILAQLAPRAVPSTMELSGCDAVIIRADADLDLAVRALGFGLRLNSGQTCIAPRRVYVARSVATEFEGRLAQMLSDHWPVAFTPAQCERLSPLLVEALAQGAHFLSGKVQAGGDIVGPVVIAGANSSLPLLREDIFAPLLTILTVADDEEAIALANDCPYALGASIFTRNETAARSLAARLNAGGVIINDLIAPTADARLPFGGRKLSGFGLTRGPEGLWEMTTTKVVTERRGRWRPHYDARRAEDAALFRDYLGLVHGGTLRHRWDSLRQLMANIRRSWPIVGARQVRSRPRI